MHLEHNENMDKSVFQLIFYKLYGTNNLYNFPSANAQVNSHWALDLGWLHFDAEILYKVSR